MKKYFGGHKAGQAQAQKEKEGEKKKDGVGPICLEPFVFNLQKSASSQGILGIDAEDE